MGLRTRAGVYAERTKSWSEGEKGTTTTYKRREEGERRGTGMRVNAETSRARAQKEGMEVG